MSWSVRGWAVTITPVSHWPVPRVCDQLTVSSTPIGRRMVTNTRAISRTTLSGLMRHTNGEYSADRIAEISEKGNVGKTAREKLNMEWWNTGKTMKTMKNTRRAATAGRNEQVYSSLQTRKQKRANAMKIQEPFNSWLLIFLYPSLYISNIKRKLYLQ